jgi:hypothetical protein
MKGKIPQSEPVRDSSDLAPHEGAEYERELAALRREIERGIEDVRNGRLSDRTVDEIATATRSARRKRQ